ncbi:TPA: nucleoside hydrolase [Providencia stuartii]|uniref:Inosine-uridine preferring nucleoside hydrolase n=1 Tax=Providencia stuartii (strain MRSN 2154) TaxID=1157951 RepID=A0A140NKI9_PROSM|nr:MULTISPECIES: nucleoside hydrolase [Providencia]AFH93393.1 inosine-uridine preferring nucleoside hydrolase [Providencia stuartii MRSN 2154]AIN65309.1 inosine-uridine preferring nucleoside hydrolase [Providencia stuartii]EMD1717378.1 nucleoside hydrolase [Providencia stuartii]MBG5895638.1 nucleoside hydrolase [Providencia stuartii]MBG5909950.1 nucleoside hydrolase [Providencia stuartii]
MPQKKIILDCDPGHDDAMAILLALGHPDIDLLAITTVVGNQTLDKVTHNAQAITEFAGGKQIPIAAGCPRPLIRNIQNAAEVHGISGLDGTHLPSPTQPLDKRHAVDLIIDTLKSHPPKTVTLVPTAGLTNIALAVRKAPEIVDLVKEVVLMGGGYHTGNRSAVAEFNIAIDPEAAHIVFNERWPLTMVGLDLTHQARPTDKIMADIAALNTPISQFVVDSLSYYTAGYRQRNGTNEHAPVHDPCAVAYVIDPTLITTQKAPVNIELQGALTTGMTVTDFRHPPASDCHTQVATRLDNARLWELFIDSLKRLPN